MSKKVCWNIFCVCWKNDEEKFNCSAEDVNPNNCRLSNINLKTMLDSVEEIYNKENKVLSIKDIICGLKEIKSDVQKKETGFECISTSKKLSFYIDKLEKR